MKVSVWNTKYAKQVGYAGIRENPLFPREIFYGHNLESVGRITQPRIIFTSWLNIICRKKNIFYCLAASTLDKPCSTKISLAILMNWSGKMSENVDGIHHENRHLVSRVYSAVSNFVSVAFTHSLAPHTTQEWNTLFFYAQKKITRGNINKMLESAP